MALKRIRKELEELKQYIKTENPPFTMGPRDGDADAGNEFCWTGVLMGPERRPYEGGVFFVRILFPVDYPFKPPVFRFETKILHPFVLAEGRVVLEMLQHSWNPAYTVKDVLHAVYNVMEDVRDSIWNDACNSECIALGDDHAAFLEKATEYTQKHAM